MPALDLPAHATVRLSADEEAYLRKFYDDAGSRGWSYDHFQRNHSQLMAAVNEGWDADHLSHEYGSPDHLTRACFEADVHRFGYDKSVYQTLQLNTLLKDAKNFSDFKTEAGKLLTSLNERHLKTEFDTAKATSTATANVLRAVADGMKFMRHRATMDTHTRPVHAALNGKVWRIDDPEDTEWRRFVVPLGFGCRCHDLFEDDADHSDIITNADAERLIGPDEVQRLTRDGFLLDRVYKKALFSQKQSYLNGLADPEKIMRKYQVGKLKYADQGQTPWADIDKNNLSALQVPRPTAAKAIADYEARLKAQPEFALDYAQRPIFFNRTDLEKHLVDDPKYLTPKENRQGIYFKIDEVLNDPDEVYFFDFAKRDQEPLSKLSYSYLKFYKDGVLSVNIEFDHNEPQCIKSWYQVDEPDNRRNGLLVHKAERP